jgi:hypothetical protein
MEKDWPDVRDKERNAKEKEERERKEKGKRERKEMEDLMQQCIDEEEAERAAKPKAMPKPKRTVLLVAKPKARLTPRKEERQEGQYRPDRREEEEEEKEEEEKAVRGGLCDWLRGKNGKFGSELEAETREKKRKRERWPDQRERQAEEEHRPQPRPKVKGEVLAGGPNRYGKEGPAQCWWGTQCPWHQEKRCRFLHEGILDMMGPQGATLCMTCNEPSERLEKEVRAMKEVVEELLREVRSLKQEQKERQEARTEAKRRKKERQKERRTSKKLEREEEAVQKEASEELEEEEEEEQASESSGSREEEDEGERRTEESENEDRESLGKEEDSGKEEAKRPSAKVLARHQEGSAAAGAAGFWGRECCDRCSLPLDLCKKEACVRCAKLDCKIMRIGPFFGWCEACAEQHPEVEGFYIGGDGKRKGTGKDKGKSKGKNKEKDDSKGSKDKGKGKAKAEGGGDNGLGRHRKVRPQ